MKPLNVAMICDLVPGQPGGSYISTLRFAELLRKKGHNVIIVAARDSRQQPVALYKEIPIYQFFSIPLPGSNRYYFYSFPKARELREIFQKEKIDIVHNMFPSYSCYVAKKVAMQESIPLVSHFHTQPENIAVFLPKFLHTTMVNNWIARYLIWFIRGSRMIISPSQLGKNILMEQDPSLPVTIISNGINLHKFYQKDASGFFKKYHLSQKNKHILFIGRLTKEKDPETLLVSFNYVLQSNKDTHLIIVGTGPLEKKLKDMAVKSKNFDKISFLGKISEDDLLDAYNICDLFVLPSLVELEGMVVLEAMACKKAIVIAESPTSASKYFIKKNGRSFIPGDPVDLSNKIIEILSNDSLRNQMAEESFKDVQEYKIDKSVEKLEEVYRSTLI